MTEAAEKIKEHVKKAIYDADRNWSKIRSERIHTIMPGMNSSRVRHLLNNLCSLEGTVYLDLGSYRGASVVSATWENPNMKAYAVDKYNFDPYEAKPYNPEGPWNTVLKSIKEKVELYKLTDRVEVIVKDVQKLSKRDIPDKVNVVYYDASSDARVIAGTVNSLSKLINSYSVLVVSNTQNREIINSFDKSIEEAKLKVYWDTELRSRIIDDKNTWWNGLKIYVLQNPKVSEKEE